MRFGFKERLADRVWKLTIFATDAGWPGSHLRNKIHYVGGFIGIRKSTDPGEIVGRFRRFVFTRAVWR